MELLTALKQWFQEDLSARINNIINILILLAILSTCSTVNRVERQLLETQTATASDEEMLKHRLIETIIQKLNEAR